MMYKLVAAAIVASVSAVKVGDMVPDVNLDYGFPPEKINLYQRVMGKKVSQPYKNTTLCWLFLPPYPFFPRSFPS